MALIDLWKDSKSQLESKHVQQIIAFAGEGKLLDNKSSSEEFRNFLAVVPSELLETYADQCLSEPFQDSGLALQDIVNEVGNRLGLTVTNGRYRGTTNHIGYDGLWCFPSGHAVVVEVKTTSAFQIRLDTVTGYRKALIKDEKINEQQSSVLIVVGRKGTGDLEAQIRGSRYAWDVRLISVDALIRLMKVKEEVDDPAIIHRVHSILIPREFTRLDEIVEIVFSATEDVKSEIVASEPIDEVEEPGAEPKVTPVSFHQACVDRVDKYLGLTLVKRTKTGYSTADNNTALVCAISKEHGNGDSKRYWFAFHPHQQEFLESAENAFVAFGCGSAATTILIPVNDFIPWLGQMWVTENEKRSYRHVHIHQAEDKYILDLRAGVEKIDLTKYLIQ